MENKFFSRTLVIGIIILFVGASVVSGTNVDIDKLDSLSLTPAYGQTSMVDWYEDFDNYTLGQYLENESDPADGGWHGWCNDLTAGAYVVGDQARSTPHSVEIEDLSDLVHEYEDVDDGQWVYTAWQYIPSDFTGESYFIMLDNYNDSNGSAQNWACQIHFTSVTDEVISDAGGGRLPIIYDEWVEIRNEIDLDEDKDTQKTYYGGVLLTEASWSEGVSGGGQTSIQAVDLFANGADPVYYDDISLVEVIPGEEPELEISDIAGGFGVSAKINNVGDGEATDTEWSITLDGGLIILGKETTGTIASIPAGESADIKSGLIFGIGKTTITVTAECAEGSSDEGTASGFVILFFVIGVS